MKNENDQLDGLIDHALESYTLSEPPYGLERRVLAAVDSACSPRIRRWIWKPVWAFAATAMLLVVVAIPFWIRRAWPRVAVVHPAIAGMDHFPLAAPASSSPLRHSIAPYARSIPIGPKVQKTTPKSSPGLIAPVTIPPITEVQPVTIAPVQISALN